MLIFRIILLVIAGLIVWIMLTPEKKIKMKDQTVGIIGFGYVVLTIIYFIIDFF